MAQNVFSSVMCVMERKTARTDQMKKDVVSVYSKVAFTKVIHVKVLCREAHFAVSESITIRHFSN